MTLAFFDSQKIAKNQIFFYYICGSLRIFN